MNQAASFMEDFARIEQERLLTAFVKQSNRIEGITREPTPAEVRAHRELIARKRVKVEHVEAFVKVCQPNAVLRATTDIHGVRVGDHIAPPSGPEIVTALKKLLGDISVKAILPWHAHVKFETLHPFTDGNGRSGRAIWLWHMTLMGQQKRALGLNFLRAFYYQTLAAQQ